MPHGISRTSLSRRKALGHLGAGTLMVGALVGPGMRSAAAQATPAAGSIEAAARQAIEAINEAMATGEASGLDAMFAPDVAGHPPHRSLVTGELFSHNLTGLKAGLADIRLFFPDAAITIDDLITSDATVAARITFRGTLDMTAVGMEEDASRPLEIGGLLYGQMTDGQISEFWAYFDPSAYVDLVWVLPSTPMATPATTHGHGIGAPTGSTQAGGEPIAVTMTEFSIDLASTTLHADRPYTFVVTNEGTVPHEFVIEQAGAVHDPLVDDEREAMTEPIAPGTSGSLSWTFTEPGAYQLACHEPGHYEAGQVLVIEVAD
jgi:uncharacterized cupredoxin-like copper-binding protein/predicted ester cyclase